MTRTANNFQLFRGDTKLFTLNFTTLAGSPIDIRGHGLWFTMKRSVDDPDSAAVLQKKIVFPETIESETGRGTLVLSSVETDLLEPGIYLYDMQKVIPDQPPIVATFISGRIQVLPDITRTPGG
ncbi:MAG: hypothetical protein H7834_12465 [Magnetococcus sp. YQC-9]